MAEVVRSIQSYECPGCGYSVSGVDIADMVGHNLARCQSVPSTAKELWVVRQLRNAATMNREREAIQEATK